MAPVKPEAEIMVDAALVSALLSEQHAELAGLEPLAVDSGWDNWMFRVGGSLAARLPRRRAAVVPLEQELRWLPLVTRGITLPVPEIVGVGRPGAGYPWPWSVVRWIAGASAEREQPAPSQAAVLGAFLAELHRPAPADAPRNDYRGVSLVTRAEEMGRRLAEARVRVPEIDHRRLDEIWSAALAAPVDLSPTWLHGDLHPRNLIVEAGRLVGVIDWGDLCVGDPACDLATAWMNFDPAHHGELWRARGRPSPATMARARGWALFFAVILVAVDEDPLFAQAGRRTLARLCTRV